MALRTFEERCFAGRSRSIGRGVNNFDLGERVHTSSTPGEIAVYVSPDGTTTGVGLRCGELLAIELQSAVACVVRLNKLRASSLEHGDMALVKTCDRALDGDPDALRYCRSHLATTIATAMEQAHG